MTDNRDPLEQLWQQQQVSVPSSKVLQAKWRKEKRKHMWYVGMDLSAVLVGPVLLYFLKDKMHWFEISWLIMLMVVTAFFTGYIVWLRRLAFTSQDASTADFCALLEKQYKQNIKIALATKYSTLAMPPLFILMFVGVYFLDLFETDRFMRKLGSVTVMLVLILPPIWIWADRRAKRFQRELAQLSQNIPLM